MLTKKFYDECQKTVLHGIRRGMIVCPPLQKPTVKETAAFRTDKPCVECGVIVAMHSPWQKMCYPCSILAGKKRDKKRREKLKLEKQNRISKSKIKFQN